MIIILLSLLLRHQQAKSYELGTGTVTSSTSFDAKEAGSISEKSNSINEVSKELKCSKTVNLDNVVVHHISSKAEGSCRVMEEVADNHQVSDGGSQTVHTEANVVVQDEEDEAVDDEKSDAFDNGMRIKKLTEVHLNIRIPNGVNLQEKFSLTSTMRMVKDYVDKHQTSVGSYDLAIPYPRKVFNDQGK